MEIIVSNTSNARATTALPEEKKLALYGNLVVIHYCFSDI